MMSLSHLPLNILSDNVKVTAATGQSDVDQERDRPVTHRAIISAWGMI